MRLDLWLLEQKQASSRSHAQELIEMGQVYLVNAQGRKVLSKASFKVLPEMNIEVEKGPANRFVSRGGLKMEGALEHTALSVDGKICLDVGISTGGFADCLLQRGAKLVIGVDVGHGQVHSSLYQHPRLKYLEGINARELSTSADFKSLVSAILSQGGFDLIVMDVSFISMTLIAPQFASLLKTEGEVLCLVKPQFEVGVQGLGKGGIVKDESLYQQVEEKIRTELERSGLQVKDYFSSSIEGKDGNREFFVWAYKAKSS